MTTIFLDHSVLEVLMELLGQKWPEVRQSEGIQAMDTGEKLGGVGNTAGGGYCPLTRAAPFLSCMLIFQLRFLSKALRLP